MKKLGFILLSGFVLLLSSCGEQANPGDSGESIDELQAIIAAQAEQITELQEQLNQQSTCDETSEDWNRFIQANDEMLWHGLTVGQVREDLLNNDDLIPIEPARYGVYARFDLYSIYVGRQTVLAYASDGHWEEQIFLSYQVEDGVITWTVIAYTHGDELHFN